MPRGSPEASWPHHLHLAGKKIGRTGDTQNGSLTYGKWWFFSIVFIEFLDHLPVLAIQKM